MKNRAILIAAAFGLLSLLVFVTEANAEELKLEICHIPPGNPGNAHFITVGESAVPAHIANHGDAVVFGDGTCTVGVGECAVDGFFACTSDGLVCDAEPGLPPEVAEVSCDDGLDNDCDGATDTDDPDCGACDFDWQCRQPLPICGTGGVGNICICDLDVPNGNSFCWGNFFCSDRRAVACASNNVCQAGWTCNSTCCGTVCTPPCPNPDGSPAFSESTLSIEGSGPTAAGQ